MDNLAKGKMMVKDNEPTGLVLRTLRRSLGLTQGDVARMLRCSRQMVNMLEKGRIGLSQDLAEPGTMDHRLQIGQRAERIRCRKTLVLDYPAAEI